MKPILIIKHIESEGPGVFGRVIEEEGIPSITLNTWESAGFPDPEDFSAILVMGGPMGVYEEDEYSFIRPELEMLGVAVGKDMPVLGVCLGAQMVAASAGARVFRGDAEEIGWFEITLSGEGLKDPVFGVISSEEASIPVFQLHGDSFDLPTGAVHLASSALFENQAFRLGSRVYGLQFHVESTEAMISKWISRRPDRDRIQADTPGKVAELNRRSELFFRRFIKNL